MTDPTERAAELFEADETFRRLLEPWGVALPFSFIDIPPAPRRVSPERMAEAIELGRELKAMIAELADLDDETRAELLAEQAEEADPDAW